MIQDFYATLNIHVTGDADTPGDALANSVMNKDYEVVSYQQNDAPLPKYISTAEYAKLHGYASQIYVSKLCARGAIPGAIKVGKSYGIPEGTPKVDRRFTAGGKYSGMYEKYGRKAFEKKKAAKSTDDEPIE